MAVGPFVITKRVQRRRVKPVENIDYILAYRLIRTQAAAILGVAGEQGEIQMTAIHRIYGLIDHGGFCRVYQPFTVQNKKKQKAKILLLTTKNLFSLLDAVFELKWGRKNA